MSKRVDLTTNNCNTFRDLIFSQEAKGFNVDHFHATFAWNEKSELIHLNYDGREPALLISSEGARSNYMDESPQGWTSLVADEEPRLCD